MTKSVAESAFDIPDGGMICVNGPARGECFQRGLRAIVPKPLGVGGLREVEQRYPSSADLSGGVVYIGCRVRAPFEVMVPTVPVHRFWHYGVNDVPVTDIVQHAAIGTLDICVFAVGRIDHEDLIFRLPKLQLVRELTSYEIPYDIDDGKARTFREWRLYFDRLCGLWRGGSGFSGN